MTDTASDERHPVQLVVTWTLVAVPLLYGLYNAVDAALQLFQG
ncbi:MFS transporter small subunit [Tsukamurella paurometabola]|uniref:Uncharacterized protein n=1 Tax=Tsukamurella paurometabola TaxID=2061 RepID=A0A3P8KL93_TSUPA|nr:hypothetical protein [Tsukamurella paurometabola]VDR41448.1 Uncharacterised protein [Tsukamurella paurometabola]